MGDEPGATDRVLRTASHRRVPRVAAVVRVLAGVLFAVFAVPKFTDHAQWVSDFGSYGLPAWSLLVYATGLAELLGGLALVAGVAVRPVAALLALVMLSAVLFGGVLGGNPGSLTMAPALLIAATYVLWTTWPGARHAARTG
ncbi:MAG: DoxX family membrane protein [Actinomycetota bacterium]|nr:DoxX family membrane protein [Actinomycetota bacterium]